MKRIESTELSSEEIVATVEGVLAHAVKRYGGTVDARTVELRLWAAAALIDSAITVSVEAPIMRSLNQKIAFLRETKR